MVTAIETLLKEGGFKPSEIQDIKNGKLLKGPVDSTSDRELAVQLAYLVKTNTEHLSEIYTTDPQKKEFDPSVTALGMISSEKGSLDDFKDVKLGPGMVKTYLSAAPGSDLNLSKEEIKSFKALGSKADLAAVEGQFRQVLLDRYRAYRAEGLKGIAPYARKKGDYHPGEELGHQIECAKILQRESPAFHKFLLEYPDARPDGIEESFFWVNSTIDDKPTVVLVQRMGLNVGDGVYLYMERNFYVSRSHNSVQGVGGAFPVDEGVVIIYRTRTSTDQVSGFGGGTKRAIGARVMGSTMAANFERARNLDIVQADPSDS